MNSITTGAPRSQACHRLSLVGLAIPFLVGMILLRGLRDQILTFHAFHGSDETTFHYPVILRFAQEFPRIPSEDYDSATSPSFHIVFAILAKVFGTALPVLRFFNVMISFACAALALRLLRRNWYPDSQTAFLAALALGLSPYFFGISFVLLTDNLATLFTLGALLTRRSRSHKSHCRGILWRLHWAPCDSLALHRTWIFATYSMANLANGATFEKYFDFFALLSCLLAFAGSAGHGPRALRFVLAAYCIGFIAYALIPYASTRGQRSADNEARLNAPAFEIPL